MTSAAEKSREPLTTLLFALIGLIGPVLLTINVPHVIHPVGGDAVPTCNGQPMSHDDVCQILSTGGGGGNFTYGQMQQRNQGGAHGMAIAGTVAGGIFTGIDGLYILGRLSERKPRKS